MKPAFLNIPSAAVFAIAPCFTQTIKILSRALFRSAAVVRPVFSNRTRPFANMALNAASHNIRELLFLAR